MLLPETFLAESMEILRQKGIASSVQSTLYLMEMCCASLDHFTTGEGGRVIIAISSIALQHTLSASFHPKPSAQHVSYIGQAYTAKRGR